MPCLKVGRTFISISSLYRLRLSKGGYVFMSWHDYCGPTFYLDKAERREVEDWWFNTEICRALDWFTGRGNKA